MFCLKKIRNGGGIYFSGLNQLHNISKLLCDDVVLEDNTARLSGGAYFRKIIFYVYILFRIMFFKKKLKI